MKATLVHKVPKLQAMRLEDPEMPARVAERSPDLYASLRDAEIRQDQSLEMVIDAFTQAGFEVDVHTQTVFQGPSKDSDVVVVVGGDGTVLDVSHNVADTPMIAINSDPDRSVGVFCACSAEQARMAAIRVKEGQAIPTTLQRMRVTLNGVDFIYPALNDVLVANAHPAMMSRYILTAGATSERHASSGIWISTPAGSTGGIRSAGGTVLPISGRMLQYLVREPFNPRGTGYRLARGVRHLYEGLRVQSTMTGGRIYVDGPYHELPFEMGDILELGEGPTLKIYDIHAELRGR